VRRFRLDQDDRSTSSRVDPSRRKSGGARAARSARIAEAIPGSRVFMRSLATRALKRIAEEPSRRDCGLQVAGSNLVLVETSGTARAIGRRSARRCVALR